MKRTKEILVGVFDVTMVVTVGLLGFVVMTICALVPVFALAGLFALTISASH